MIYIESSAVVDDLTIVGEGTRIYKNASVKRSSLGEKCLIGDSCRIEDSKFGFFTWAYPNGTVYSSQIGDYSYAQKNSSIWHSSIGKFCSLSWNVSVGGGNHDYHRVTTHSALYAPMYGFVDTELYDRFSDPCVIGNDVWIGAGASILRGVSVGDGAVIAAGAVVTKNVEPYSIVAGVPAKKIGQRCDDKLIESLLLIKWWDFPEKIIKDNLELFNAPLSAEVVDKLLIIKDDMDLRN